PEAISCVLPGTSLTTGQWVRVADSDDPVDCDSNSDNDPFRCPNVTSPATINLYLAHDKLPVAQEGWYKCCLPTDCSNASNSIFANIFIWAQIEDIRVDFPADITVLPQTYTLHAIKIGNSEIEQLHDVTWYYESGSASTEITPDLCSGQSAYSCTIGNGVAHSSTGSYDYTLNVTWNRENITSGVLSQSNNNGDHVYKFYLHIGEAMRNKYITITGITIFFIIPAPATAPSSLTQVNKTATTITVSWTALVSSDVDGYVVNVTSDTDTVQTVQVEGSSNNTITLNGLNIETTYSITVRAYQQLLGPASSTISAFTHCQQKGIHLAYKHNGNCYPNGSYFWDSRVKSANDALSCVLPGTSLTTGQWVRVADPDDPVDCNSNSASDPFHCTNVTSPDATINLYLAGVLSADEEGWYKCCLPTDCSNTM
uniref:Fibronectin type-III domain-containing protein n=1 Tax=Amphimedon queenslandica TaxID=400682 RepID=A0A1X7SUJ9_AMPQE